MDDNNVLDFINDSDAIGVCNLKVVSVAKMK